MSGIAGIYSRTGHNVRESDIMAMLERIRHRGPDGIGVQCSHGIGLGHVRLAIRPTSTSAPQPLKSEDGRFILSFSGSLFNTTALLQSIGGARQRTPSRGDTALLLDLIDIHGVEETLMRLDGMWALALWDDLEQTLVLARDPCGAKPLYYCDYSVASPGELRFASEMKALLPSRAEVDPATLDAMLLCSSALYGGRTPFRNVRSVLPGQCVAFRKNKQPEEKFFFRMIRLVDRALHAELRAASDAAVVERVEAALVRSTKEQLTSGAPIGYLVSGGVDSALVASLGKQHSDALRLYHSDVVCSSERRQAEEFARLVSADLNIATMTDQDLVDDLVTATYHNERPLIYHSNTVPLHLVASRAAEDGIKVLMTGEATDSLFAGSPFVVLEPLLKFKDESIGFLQDLFHRLSPRAGDLLWPRHSESSPEQLARLLFRSDSPLLESECEEAFSFIPQRERRLNVGTLRSLHWDVPPLLLRNDRLGMAAGVETRSPFLSREMMQLALNLPSHFKVRWTRRTHNIRHPFVIDKWVIRAIAAKYVTREFAYRPKKGFPVPLYSRLRTDLAFFEDRFTAGHYGLNKAALQRHLDDSPAYWLTRLLMLEIWGRLFVLGEAPDEIQEAVRRHVTILAAS